MSDDPEGDAALAEALVAEAWGTRAIDHPNVVRVIDVGRDPRSGRTYLVMEQVEGENLAARLRAVGRLDEAVVRRLGAAIADGMQAAHARGIVHRDLKPANVMLCGDDPKIVDFGIAKHLGARSAVTTARRIGTPAYMAPEQLAGGLIAPCVDIWALGVILFEAVTGVLPFAGFDDGRCPQLFEAPRRASSLAAVSPSLDALLGRCLEREPGRRPSSMEELARALRSSGGEERITQDVGAVPAAPIVAAPIVAAPRARRRGWIAAGAGVIAAIAIGAIVASTSSSSTVPVTESVPVPVTESVTVPVPVTETVTVTVTETETESVPVTDSVTDRRKPAPPRRKPARPSRPPRGETLD